jgi:hypothetical protein
MAEDSNSLPAMIGGLLVGFIALLIIKFLEVFPLLSLSWVDSLMQGLVELVVIIGFGILGLLVNDKLNEHK